MARPKLDMVVEVDERRSSEGTEMPSKCIVSDMKTRKTFKSKVKIRNRVALDFNLFLVGNKPADDPDWEDWRNSLKMTIGGHTFGGLLGFGGDNASAHMHFCRFLGLCPKQEANWFAKRAMQHGHEKEQVVRNHFKVFRLLGPSNEKAYENESLLYELSRNESPGFSVSLCITPDILTQTSVYEIKCPHYNSDQFEDPMEYKNDVESRNLKKYNMRINPSWWFQAALYAYITGKRFFTLIVCYYTTRTDRYVISLWHFDLDWTIKLFIAEELLHILTKAEECMSDPQKLIGVGAKKYKPNWQSVRVSGMANQVLNVINSCMYFSEDTPTCELHIDGTILPIADQTSIIDPEPGLRCMTPTNNLLS